MIAAALSTPFWSRQRRAHSTIRKGLVHIGHSGPRDAGPHPRTPPEQSDVVAYHKERVDAQEHRSLWSGRFRNKRVGRRPHQEGGPDDARPPKCERRQVKRRQEGRARRGMIKLGREPRLADFR